MKNYRIVRLWGLAYDDVAKTLIYRNNPDLKNRPYSEQQRALFQASLIHSDGFSRAMKSLGHDAHEIVYDCEILQKTWAKEKGIEYNPETWLHEIALKQIQYLRPDIVYFQDIFSIPYCIRKNLKNQFPFIKLKVIQKGYPGEHRDLSDADVLLVSSPILYDRYKDLNTHLVYHSFDDAVLEKIDFNGSIGHAPKYDFIFVGSSRAPESRYWALLELIQRTCLEVWVYELEKSRKPRKLPTRAQVKAQMRKTLKGFLWYCDAETLDKMLTLGLVPDRLRRVTLEIIEHKREAPEQHHYDATKDERRLPVKSLRKMFPHRCHAPVFGLDMYSVFSRSKIVFNKHSDPAENTVDNMKMFEATGVGTCLLTDTGRNMSDLFEEDYEVVTYLSIEECIEKVNYLLEHDDVRRQIAEAGQRRTLKDHTVLNRCQQIDEILQKML